MAAEDHLSPVQFFHSTPAELRPGDVLDPRHEPRTAIPSQHGHVYVGTTPNAFRTFYRPFSYQVEPTGPVETDPMSDGFRSAHPMRVVREVSREEGDQDRWYEDDYQDAVDRLKGRP